MVAEVHGDLQEDSDTTSESLISHFAIDLTRPPYSAPHWAMFPELHKARHRFHARAPGWFTDSPNSSVS